ncbi:hypothetical protein GW17_00009562 [Ensete ventricosum]|nr:hypothetical protein GW17_00009562 [Ensete ventricosum]
MLLISRHWDQSFISISPTTTSVGQFLRPSRLSPVSYLLISLVISLQIIDSFVTSLYLSYNELDGPVPDSPAFRRAPAQWFAHNFDLCGVVQGLPPCVTLGTATRNTSMVVIPIIAPVAFFLLLFISVAAAFRFHKRRKPAVPVDDSNTKEVAFCILNFDGRDVCIQGHHRSHRRFRFQKLYRKRCIWHSLQSRVNKWGAASGEDDSPTRHRRYIPQISGVRVHGERKSGICPPKRDCS